MHEFKKEIIGLVKKHIKISDDMIEQPPGDMGDYAVPVFRFAKEFNKSPNDVAKDIAEVIKPTKLISGIQNTGPYINFFVNRIQYAKNVLKIIDNKYGRGSKQKDRVMIEYCQVNTHKAFHVGHLRGTFLGAAIINLFRFSGYKVVAANYQGDIGAHVAKVIWYLKNNNVKYPEVHKGRWLGQIFQKAKANAYDNKEALSQVLQKLEYNVAELTKLWKETRKWSLHDFESFYKLVGVGFDEYFFESQFEKKGKEIVDELLKKNIAEHSEGAVIIDLGQLDKFLLLKSDGTALYSTKDLSLAKVKFQKFKIDQSVYVVGAEQKLYFQQLFATLDKMGFSQAKRCAHIPFSLVTLKGGKISSREGELLYAEELVEDVIETAKKAVLERHKDLDEAKIRKRAHVIGLGAIKFSFLNQDNNKEIVFDKEKSLSFEGETGPYIQYTYARIKSILRKSAAKNKVIKEISDEEHEIVRQLAKFPEVVSESCRMFHPSTVCRYLLDLCQLFNSYYHSTQILKSEEFKNQRLYLIDRVQEVLKSGLSLLGIEVTERM